MSSFSCNRFALGLAGVVAAVCAAVTPSSAVSAVPAKTSLPSFACYEASFSVFRSSNARIADQFGKRVSPVAAATTICAEASVNSLAKPALPLHLACHGITDRRPLPLGVRIRSSLGTEQLSLGAGQKLCTPASITTSGVLAAPPGDIDSFTCYAVRTRTASPRTVTVADEFGPAEDSLGAVTTICAPASVDGSRVRQKRLLACYRLTSDTAAPAVIVRSALGLLKASTGLRRQLCVPSSRL
jgi:hypothetical protein